MHLRIQFLIYHIAPFSILFLLLGGCADKKQAEPSVPAPVPPEVLARIGDLEIHEQDVRAYLEMRGGPGRFQNPKQEVMDELIIHYAQAELARKQGLEQDPEFIRARRNHLVGLLRQQELEPQLRDVEVSESEVESRYERDRDAKYLKPAMRRGAVIEFEVPFHATPDQVEAALARAAAARDEALQGPVAADPAGGFGALAATYSSDQASRYKGGDMGWFVEGRAHARWPEALAQTLFDLPEPGAISHPVQTDRAIYLVRLTEARESSVIPFEEAEETIRRSLMNEHRREVEDAFLDRVRDRVEIEVFEKNLDRLDLQPAPPLPSPRPPSYP